MANVSVVIPVCPPHFQLMTKLVDQLEHEQTVKPKEILVCASQCASSRKLLPSTSKARVLSTLKHCSAAQNRNRGIEAATGEWILFCDADDVLHPQKIEILQSALTLVPSIHLICHNYNTQQETFLLNKKFGHLNINDIKPCINSPSPRRPQPVPNQRTTYGHAFVRADVAKALLFDENLKRSEDTDFCYRVNERFGGVYYVPHQLIHYRKSLSATPSTRNTRLSGQ